MNDYKLYVHVVVILVCFTFFYGIITYKVKVMYISLTIVTVETSPNKLVVVCDLVDNSTKTAYTVLYNLGSRYTTNDTILK